jgi:Uma2 family endonuclease
MNDMSSGTILAVEPARFSVDEFMDMAAHPPICDWTGKTELMEGVIVRMSPAHYPHFAVQRKFFILLHSIFGDGLNGLIVGQELMLRMIGLENSALEPDVCIFREPPEGQRLADSNSVLLAIEISDTTFRTDFGTKREFYATAGIPHYWVADINARETHVMSDPANGDYRKRDVIAFAAPLPVPGCDQSITID